MPFLSGVAVQQHWKCFRIIRVDPSFIGTYSKMAAAVMRVLSEPVARFSWERLRPHGNSIGDNNEGSQGGGLNVLL